LRAALQDEHVKQRLTELGAVIPPLDKQTPEGLRSYLESEVGKWDKVIKASGVQAE